MRANAGSHREDAAAQALWMSQEGHDYYQTASLGTFYSAFRPGQQVSFRVRYPAIIIAYNEDMRLESLPVFIFMLRAVQSAPLLPLSQKYASSRRLEASSCQFFGFIDDKDLYNGYTIKMAGWGNDGSASSCAEGISSIIQTQCNAQLDNFACTQVYENLHDTKITFDLDKAVVAQPDCVTEALRMASSSVHDEQTIECSCLAQCWQSQRMV
ncbi:hypothetical protein GGR55DRAFT_674713 [Xylaria sp. FL0064]|nr:hypothetical protein GGR55DRAFT_674713 [Xylaria sp. FL0064]